MITDDDISMIAKCIAEIAFELKANDNYKESLRRQIILYLTGYVQSMQM